jgi:hypothetical protein
MPRPDEFADRGRDRRLLYFVRRYAAKLLYEIEFHTASRSDLDAAHANVELLADALKISPSPTDYLADMDGGFYVTEYLRSWAFEAPAPRLPAASSSATTGFAEPRGRWAPAASSGRRPAVQTADELLEDVPPGRGLQMLSVAERVREVLPANGSR